MSNVQMNRIEIEDILKGLRVVSGRLDQEINYLCQLDGEIGDGDHGTTMALGFRAINAALVGREIGSLTISELFNICGSNFLETVGATAGPLYARAFYAAENVTEGQEFLSANDLRDTLGAMIDAVMTAGGARQGDKTMLDLWLPVHFAMTKMDLDGGFTQDQIEILKGRAMTAADSTKSMIAVKGRAARLGERTIGQLDPGAVSSSMIVFALADAAVMDIGA